MSLKVKSKEEKLRCPQRYSVPTQDDRAKFGQADKNMFISPTTVLSRSYFSPVSEAKPLKVYYHLVRWRSFLLVNWFCGLKATRLLSILQLTQPDRTWCICAHIFSLFLSKNQKGWARKASFEGGVWNHPWRKVGPSIALFFPLFRLCVAHKGSRQAGRNQFHGATRWK